MRLYKQSIALTLIIINIIMFFLELFVRGFTSLFVLRSDLLLSQPWIILTSMFLHADPNHIFFNMYALFIFGVLIEQRIGKKRFLILYFVSGVLAAIGFSLFQELVLRQSASALGASGAIMGVIGMTIMLFPDMRVLLFFFIPMSMRTAGILFALIDIFGLFYNSGVANMAHIVGLAVGLIYGHYLLSQRESYHRTFRRRGMKRSGHTITIELSDDDVEDYLRRGRI